MGRGREFGRWARVRGAWIRKSAGGGVYVLRVTCRRWGMALCEGMGKVVGTGARGGGQRRGGGGSRIAEEEEMVRGKRGGSISGGGLDGGRAWNCGEGWSSRRMGWQGI